MSRGEAESRWLLIGLVLCGVGGGVLQAGLASQALYASSISSVGPEVRGGVGPWLAMPFGCVAAVGALISVAEPLVGLLMLLTAFAGSALSWWSTMPLGLLGMAILLAARVWRRDSDADMQPDR